jgi:hypothetical protein
VSDATRVTALAQIMNPGLDYLRRKALHKRIVAQAKKVTLCPNCGFRNGLSSFHHAKEIFVANSFPTDLEM